MSGAMDDGNPFRREAIRELMAREGLSAAGFARRASVSRTLVGGWLSGVVSPQIRTLDRLAKAFNVDLMFFFKTGDER